MNKIDELAIKTLQINGVAAIEAANSGHPGIVLGAAPIVHTLFSRHISFDTKNTNWINRDRFILSAGHGSALLYAQLHILGLITTDDLMNFRKLNSMTPGHPEHKHTPGVEATTGPLGQGIAMAVGLAIGQEHLNFKFNEITHHTYVLCGDGDLQEGVAMEAISFAGHQKLKNLIVLHDSNDIQLDTRVENVFSENIKMKMESQGWEYLLVENPTTENIDKAIIQAKKSDKPSFIEVKTIIGKGAIGEGTSSVHGSPLGEECFKTLKENLGWKYQDFEIPKEVKKLYSEIQAIHHQKFKDFVVSDSLATFLLDPSPSFEIKLTKNVATRVTSGEVIKYLNNTVEQWIGGSADLVASTKAGGADGNFSAEFRIGRNIQFGVREFAMGAIANGIALHSNFKPFVSTFFVFSDYLKPAIRMAALMKLPITYVFTHDSVFVGEDGPTHEPIEQIAMLRSIPDLNVFRPGDENEVLGAYKIAISSKDIPSAILLTRQNIKSLPTTKTEEVNNGSYYLNKIMKPKGDLWTLVATGSELSNAYEIGVQLGMNVVSITNFKDVDVTWDVSKAISIEAASTFGWSKFAKYNFGIDSFGLSGDGKEIYKHFNLDKKSLINRIQTIINK